MIFGRGKASAQRRSKSPWKRIYRDLLVHDSVKSADIEAAMSQQIGPPW